MRGLSLILILMTLGLASCRGENISTDSSVKAEPSVDTNSDGDNPSVDSSNSVEESEETTDSSKKSLSDLVDKNVLKSTLLENIVSLDTKVRHSNVLKAIDGMIDGSIYYDDGNGISFKSGAKMTAQVFWAGFYYGESRYVTGNKYNLDVYYNDVRYSGIYLTPKRINNVDFDQIKTTYVETSFQSAGVGLYSPINHNMTDLSTAYLKLKDIKSVVMENNFRVNKVGNINELIYEPSDAARYETVTITNDHISYGRFFNYNLDIMPLLNDILACIDKIQFEEFSGDLYTPNKNPLFNDQRANDALKEKLGIE